MHKRLALVFMSLAVPPAVLAQLVINEDLTGTASTYDWRAVNGACLTAGDGRASSIPACIGLRYYRGQRQVGGEYGRMPYGERDRPGRGALRLTNGGHDGTYQSGIVYSNFEFPSNLGVDMVFSTVTYGGNGYPNHNGQQSGGDGIAFFLVDAAKVRGVVGPPKIGILGGGLAYRCSKGGSDGRHSPADGMLGGYIGLGIDEYGNFSQKNNGYPVPSSISLRGAGSIRWDWLHSTYPQYYPESVFHNVTLRTDVVEYTCWYGGIADFSDKGKPKPVPNAGIPNYRILTSHSLPGSVTIFSQQKEDWPSRYRAQPLTFNLKITQEGLLSLSYSFNGGRETIVMRDVDITRNNGPLPEALRFGFSASTGAASNVHEITCFKAESIGNASSSAGGNIPPGGRVQVGSQLYLASYHRGNWWGQLRAHGLLLNDDDSASIDPKAIWDASCVLTGGACIATGSEVNASAQTSRRLLTWNGTAGVELSHGGLSDEQKQSLPAEGQRAAAFIDYLRGARDNEIRPNGAGWLRRRDSVLGDIINSSPTWVGAPSLPYADTWADRLHPDQSPAERDSYKQFADRHAQRSHVVYVGANDGFLHGFRAGRTLADGSFEKARNDGAEVLGYLPSQALRTMAHPAADPRLDYGSTRYSHNAYVDATPGVGDLFVRGNWRTWLAGGLGAGGNVDANGVPQGAIADDLAIGTGTLYLLDVTNPDAFATDTPSQLVKGEWNSHTIVCEGDVAASRCGDSLGNTYGTPLIRRLHHGGWGVIFPNGQNSRSGKSGIFILLIDPKTGAVSFRFLPAGEPLMDKDVIKRRNGITQVTAADLDADHITDYVYAGDMLGNVWRFDLTSDKVADWSVGSRPIFNADQPITTSILVSATNRNYANRVILNFGTGKIYPQTLNQGAYFRAGPYALYGIWDADMQTWNEKSGMPYESLPSSEAATIRTEQLQTQTLTRQSFVNSTLGISGLRTITQKPVCWKNGTDCATTNDNMGWRVVLPESGEQIVYNPTLMDGMLLVNTTTPEISRVLTCNVKPQQGYMLALRPDTGSTAAKNYFQNTGYKGGAVIAGIGASGTGGLMPVETGSRKFIVTQTSDGTGKAFEVDPAVNASAQRINWRRLR